MSASAHNINPCFSNATLSGWPQRVLNDESVRMTRNLKNTRIQQTTGNASESTQKTRPIKHSRRGGYSASVMVKHAYPLCLWGGRKPRHLLQIQRPPKTALRTKITLKRPSIAVKHTKQPQAPRAGTITYTYRPNRLILGKQVSQLRSCDRRGILSGMGTLMLACCKNTIGGSIPPITVVADSRPPFPNRERWKVGREGRAARISPIITKRWCRINRANKEVPLSQNKKQRTRHVPQDTNRKGVGRANPSQVRTVDCPRSDKSREFCEQNVLQPITQLTIHAMNSVQKEIVKFNDTAASQQNLHGMDAARI